MSTHVIDLGVDPELPAGMALHEHIRAGRFTWDTTEIALFMCLEQKHHRPIAGKALQRNIASRSPLNANVLDYFAHHPAFIPDSWKGMVICFWGTIYCGSIFPESRDSLYVPVLFQDEGRWWGSFRPLCNEWWDRHPAAVWL